MRLKPPQVLALSFFFAIVAGTLLLSLPIAQNTEGGISLVDRVFTATSATCVTGLIVRDTPKDWTAFGRTIIFILFQAGGLGIMTFSTFFAVILGRRLTLREYDVLQDSLGHNREYQAKRLVKYIIALTFAVELAGAALLFLRWSRIEDWSIGERLAQSVFHSVSAFCNAGFALFSGSFMGYEGDLYINLIMAVLIFLGGIGFVVILDTVKGVFIPGPYRKSRLSLQSKIVLITSFILIAAGAGLIYLLESDNTMTGMSVKEKLLGSVFQSVTARTAGFNTLAVGRFAPGTLVLLVFLMFVGASPGSTGGGIKTCTFAIVVAAAWAMSKNRDKVFMFGRTLPRTVVRRAILIFVLAIGWLLAATFLFSISERNALGAGDLVIRSLFEVTSAFGTVGLSTGITPCLSVFGKVLIIITMFVGRIGPLTMALAIALEEGKVGYSYPEEKVMVG